MLTLSPNTRSRYEFLRIIPIVFAAWALESTVCSAAGEENVTVQSTGPGGVAVRIVGNLRSAAASRILRQVRVVPFNVRHDSPVLLQGATLSQLNATQRQELKATYRAGYTIVLLGANLQHANALHAIVGEGVNYRSKDTGILLAYALRRENFIPTATLVTRLDPSTLETPSGDPDPTGLLNEQLALSQAVARTVSELTHAPHASVPAPPRDPGQAVDWLSNPIQSATYAINSPYGVYNTLINVYALYRCFDQTDHYAVTAQADWTATTALWQSATSEGPNPTMYLDNGGNLVINWQNADRTYCSSPGAFESRQDVCRYINYPLSYTFNMIPRSENPVVQLNAAPGASQGQQRSYQSGFSFSVQGAVNVSAMGPGGGVSFGATWSNTTTTSVPPLIVNVSNTGNEGVDWNFQYCTSGLEPDPGTNCTSHVQMVKDVCQAQLGDDSGTNPQHGQTPAGKFSNAVQSAHWQQDASARAGTAFDIEVGFQANLAVTDSHLNNGLSGGVPDPLQSCNTFGCGCTSFTSPHPIAKSFTFQIPYPSTKCQ